jgi:Tfp pilus assembly protein PilV
MKRNYHKEAGFTLVEALVSLLVLTMGLVPAYFLSSSSEIVADDIKNNLIAANLAQEGVEVIHAIRDTNWFASQAFNNGLGAGDYEAEWNSGLPLGASQDRFLRVDANGRYNYTTGTTTPFKRMIRIAAVSAQEFKVTSIVTWTTRKRDKSVQVESHLFDWK